MCERLLELAKKGSSLQKQNNKPDTRLEQTFTSLSVRQNFDKASNSDVPTIKSSPSKDSLKNLGKKRRYKKSLLATRTRYKSISMEDLDNDNFKSVLDRDQDQHSTGSSSSGLNNTLAAGSESEDDDDCIVFGNSTVNLKSPPGTQRQVSAPTEIKREMPGTSRQVSAPSKVTNDIMSDVKSEVTQWSIDESMTGEMSEDCVQKVSYASSEDTVECYVTERAEDYEVCLTLYQTTKF